MFTSRREIHLAAVVCLTVVAGGCAGGTSGAVAPSSATTYPSYAATTGYTRNGPTVICDQRVYPGPDLPPVLSGAVAVTATNMAGDVLLQLSDDCRHGRDCSVAPGQAATVSTAARAQDGSAVVVVLTPKATSFVVRCTRAGQPEQTIQIQLPPG